MAKLYIDYLSGEPLLLDVESGNPFDQDLNTTDNVLFKYLTVKDSAPLEQTYPVSMSGDPEGDYFSADVYGGLAVHLGLGCTGGGCHFVQSRLKIYGEYGETAISGTVEVTEGSDQVVGTDTAFGTELNPSMPFAGDFVWLVVDPRHPAYYRVKSVEDATHATLCVPSKVSWSGDGRVFNEKTIFTALPDGTIGDIANLSVGTMTATSFHGNYALTLYSRYLGEVWVNQPVYLNDVEVINNSLQWTSGINTDEPAAFGEIVYLKRDSHIKAWNAAEEAYAYLIYPELDSGAGATNWLGVTDAPYNPDEAGGGLLFFNHLTLEVHGGIDGVTGDLIWDKDVSVAGELTVNYNGIDRDMRVLGDTDANLLFVDASTDRVGIGTASPTDKLHVNGNTKITGSVGVTGGEPGAYAITNYTGVVGGSDNWMQLWDSTGGMYINIYSGGGGPTFYTPNLLELRGGSGLNIGADGASITLNAGWSTLPYYTDGNIDISSADTKFRFGPNLWAGGVADTELTRMGAGILQTNASFHALDDVQIGNDVLLDSGSHIKWATAEANLLLYYKLDEPASTATAVDSSGNSYDGTNTNCTTGWDGRINGGYFYNKYAPSYTTCSEKTAFIFGTGDFTLSCWIRSGGLADQQAAIGKYNGTAAYWWLGIDGNTPVFGLNGVSCYGATGVVDTKWHLLTGVRSGNNITVYLDGVAGTPADVTGLSDTLDDYPVVGALGTPIVACWFGRLDEIKIYSRALSEAEILALKECRIAAFDTSLYRSAANLVAIDGGLVVNETGADSDTRIEGTGDENLLFVDASEDKIGIGTDTPAEKLDVVGNIASSGTIATAAANKWDLGGPDKAPTVDTGITVTIDGTSYRLAAEEIVT